MRPWRWLGEGCTIDITAFPVEEGEDAWPAGVALTRYLGRRAAARAGDGELRWWRMLAVVR